MDRAGQGGELAELSLSGADYTDKLHDYYAAYPHAGYGGSFHHWARARRRSSMITGSAVRPRCG